MRGTAPVRPCRHARRPRTAPDAASSQAPGDWRTEFQRYLPGAVRCIRVGKGDAVLRLQLRDHVIFSEIVAIVMRNRNVDDIAGIVSVR